MLTACDRESAGRAGGRGNEGVMEEDALLCELIEGGGGDRRVAKDAGVGPRPVVADEDKDVGPGFPF